MSEPNAPIRVGLIGCGRIAAVHLRHLRAVPGVRVVAACDLDRERARAFGREAGIEETAGNPADLLGLGLDAVHVLTPPPSHADTTIAALERGLHVLVEKPMATTAAEARRMQAAAAAAGRLLCVDHNRLFDPVIAEARQLVAGGALGTLVSAEAYQGVNLQEGGAAAPLAIWLNLAPHPLYLLRAFIGEVADWQAFAGAQGELRAVLRGERALGYLCFSPGASPYLNALSLHGTKATLHIDLNTMTLLRQRKRRLPSMLAKAALNVDQAVQLLASTTRTTLQVVTRRTGTYPGMGEVVRRFYAAVVGGSAVPVSGADGVAVVELLEQMWGRTHGAAVPRRRRGAASGPVVLVTGASGFLGRHVAAALAAAGCRVRALVRFPSVADGPDVDEVIGTLGDDDVIAAAVAGADAVVHCAARVARGGSRDDFFRDNVTGTRHLLEAARRAGVARFVHVSSIAVYGVHRGPGPVAEDVEYDPYPERRGAYTWSKLEADRLVRAAGGNGMTTVVLRPGILVGADGPPFTARLCLGRIGGRVVIVGRGDARLPLCHVDDVAQAAVLALRAPAAGGAYNLVDETLTQDGWLREQASAVRPLYVPPALAAVPALGLELAARAAKRGAPALSRYKIRRATESIRYDTARARRDLGWQPAVGVCGIGRNGARAERHDRLEAAAAPLVAEQEAS